MQHNDDSTNLAAMKQLISLPLPDGMALARLTDQLLKKRDALSFVDDNWYDALTEHIVTLDSAATFEPSNADEKRQVENALGYATSEIRRLVDAKMT